MHMSIHLHMRLWHTVIMQTAANCDLLAERPPLVMAAPYSDKRTPQHSRAATHYTVLRVLAVGFAASQPQQHTTQCCCPDLASLLQLVLLLLHCRHEITANRPLTAATGRHKTPSKPRGHCYMPTAAQAVCSCKAWPRSNRPSPPWKVLWCSITRSQSARRPCRPDREQQHPWQS